MKGERPVLCVEGSDGDGRRHEPMGVCVVREVRRDISLQRYKHVPRDTPGYAQVAATAAAVASAGVVVYLMQYVGKRVEVDVWRQPMVHVR